MEGQPAAGDRVAALTFVLPAAGAEPIGGFRVVYQYANAAASLGHRVFVVHSAELYKWESPYWFCKRLRQQWKYLAGRDYRPTSWFALHPAIETSYVRVVDDSALPRADVIVATGWSTALPVACAASSKGRGFQLIQGFETFAGPDAAVRASWKLPLRKLVISRWLLDLAATFGESAELVPNGIDFDLFGVDVPIRARAPSIAMLYHPDPAKGCASALAALGRIHAARPDVAVDVFGAVGRPSALAPWMRYVAYPTASELRALYNRASVFVAPSMAEGWPLPPAEAQACGAAVCASDIAGHREYLIDGATATLFPAGDSQRIAAALRDLVDDSAKRIALASAGREHIGQFSLEAASRRFLSYLQLDGGPCE